MPDVIDRTFDAVDLLIHPDQPRRRYVPGRRLHLTAERLSEQCTRGTRIRSPFLNGRIRAFGSVQEVSRPSAAVLRAGVCFLAVVSDRDPCVTVTATRPRRAASIIEAVVTHQGQIECVNRHERLIQWHFAVIGQRCDGIYLFRTAEPPPAAVGYSNTTHLGFTQPGEAWDSIEPVDLLDLLGFTQDDVDLASAKLRLTGEGGFKID